MAGIKVEEIKTTKISTTDGKELKEGDLIIGNGNDHHVRVNAVEHFHHNGNQNGKGAPRSAAGECQEQGHGKEEDEETAH